MEPLLKIRDVIIFMRLRFSCEQCLYHAVIPRDKLYDEVCAGSLQPVKKGGDGDIVAQTDTQT
jgi:hypothetical protein